MIRFLRDVVPLFVPWSPTESWETVRDRVRRYLEEARDAFAAMPRWEERDLRYVTGESVTVSLGYVPRAVWATYATVGGVPTPPGVVTWQVGADGRSVVLSGIAGLSSGIRYDVRLLIMGAD